MLPMNRSGMEIRQCTGCEGVFVDQAELERMIAAEAHRYAPPPPRPVYEEPYRQPGGILGGLLGGKHGGGYVRRRGGHH